MSDIEQRLREEALRLSGRSIDRGCLDSGIAANLANEAADTIASLRSKLEEAEGARGSALVATPPAGGDDWTVDDTLTAREILDYLGIGSDASLEPYADRRRDAVAKIIQKRIATTPPAERVVEAGEYFIQERDDDMLICAKHWQLGSTCIARRPKLATNDEWRSTAERIVSALATKPAVKDDETVVEALRGATASLVAAVSLLKRGSKKAAPSDKMFDQMILDYEKSIKDARAALAAKDGRS